MEMMQVRMVTKMESERAQSQRMDNFMMMCMMQQYENTSTVNHIFTQAHPSTRISGTSNNAGMRFLPDFFNHTNNN